MKKKIFFEIKAKREYDRLPDYVRSEFDTLIEDLGRSGQLGEPESKKLKSYALFELRVKVQSGIWRAFYCYVVEGILILGFFKKKSRKTPKREIEKVLRRIE